MRKIRDVIRLSAMGLGQRDIARACSIVQSTVHKYQKLAKAANLGWPLPDDWDDDKITQVLLAREKAPGPHRQHPPPDFNVIHRELETNKNVTLELLWQEYRQAHPEGYGYSRFCDLYGQWRQAKQATMRFSHQPGQKMFVDYAGATISIHSHTTDEIREASIFVAVLGYSSYTFAFATFSQELPHWITAHIHAFEYFQGVSELIIIDNLKSGVTKSCRYEPDLNPTYQDLAEHYGTAVLPARPRKPRDKAKAEVAVQIVQRWIVAALRKRRFYSLEEINQAIGTLLVVLNGKSFRKREGTRAGLFSEREKAALKPLPAQRFSIGEWSQSKVDLGYHVAAAQHLYSVPYQLIGQQVDIRLSLSTVEIFHRGLRVASHPRGTIAGEATTTHEHRPKSHQVYLEWTPTKLLTWSERVGPRTAELFQRILTTKPHPEIGFRSCIGIARLGGTFALDRLEAAAARALHFGTYSLHSIRSILRHHLENQPLDAAAEQPPAVTHDNIRGADYFDSIR